MKRRTIVQRSHDYGMDREKPLGFSLKFLKVE